MMCSSQSLAPILTMEDTLDTVDMVDMADMVATAGMVDTAVICQVIAAMEVLTVEQAVQEVALSVVVQAPLAYL